MGSFNCLCFKVQFDFLGLSLFEIKTYQIDISSKMEKSLIEIENIAGFCKTLMENL